LFKTLNSTSLLSGFSSYRAVPERSLRSGFCLFLDKKNYIDITVLAPRNPNRSQTGFLSNPWRCLTRIFYRSKVTTELAEAEILGGLEAMCYRLEEADKTETIDICPWRKFGH
jgi:hypothetical protein